MKLKNKMAALGVSVVLAVGGTAGIANADTTSVGGELNTSGSLVQYNTTRTHTFNGSISLNVTNMPSGYLRLGLRNMKVAGGPQFTDTIQWNAPGGKEWYNILKDTKFALQGRMKPGSWYSDNYWGGTLTY